MSQGMMRHAKSTYMLLAQCLGITETAMDAELHKVAMNGDVEGLMRKLSGYSVMETLQTTSQGETALHIAARYGHEECVKNVLLMLSKGGTVTVMSMACFGCSRPWRTKNADGNTALHEAAKNGHGCVIAAILEHDPAMASMANKNGETALFLAATHGSTEAVKVLVPHSSVTHKRKDGRTCFHLATLQGKLEVLKILVDESTKGTQGLAIRDSTNASSLHSAVQGGSIEVVQYVLQKSPDLVFRKDKFGRAAIHLAAQEGNKEILNAIASERPECVGLKSRDGKTILHFAVQSQNLEMLDWISTQQYQRFWGDEYDKNGNTPLHLAAIYLADEQLVTKLIDAFQKSDVKAANKDGFTCMDLVCLNMRAYPNAEEVRKRLREAGAGTEPDVNECNILDSSEEQRQHYSRMIQTNAVIAALLATVAMTGPTDKVADDHRFIIYMVANNISFYSSMTVIFVWILLEPLSRTGECSWLRSSMYMLGCAVAATAVAYYVFMQHYVNNHDKNGRAPSHHTNDQYAEAASPFPAQNEEVILSNNGIDLHKATSLMVPLVTLAVIRLKMVAASWGAHHASREYMSVLINRLSIRIYIVYIVLFVLSLVISGFIFIIVACLGIISLLCEGVLGRKKLHLVVFFVAVLISSVVLVSIYL